MQIQETFVKKIKEMVPAHVSLAEEIAELLNISSDSAYRRLRCETGFSLQEVYTLAKHYNFSVDTLFSFKNDFVTCNYIRLADQTENFEKYINSLAARLKSLQKLEDKKVVYAAEEVPIFHSLGTEALRAFKLFYWQRSVLNIPEYQNKKFLPELLSERLVSSAALIYSLYNAIPSIEIWTDSTILTTLKQIEFYYESGAFKDKKDPLLILEDLHEMIARLNQWAESESKLQGKHPEKNFSLYHSDLAIGTNCIHIHSQEGDSSYISFNTVNSLTTSNRTFCEEIVHWQKNLIKKSTLVSGTSEKQRFRFFNQMQKQVTALEEKIKAE